MARGRVNLMVSSDSLQHFSEVVQRLESAGLSVEQQLPEAGVVTGTFELSELGRLQAIDGVAAVEPSRDFQLAPPDSEGPH